MKLHISFLFLFLSLLSEAVGQEHFFKQYSHVEGLNHSYIYSMNQDGGGFMWIGTAEGLYKFNGFDFEYFTTEDGLADNFILELFRDKSDKLWIGHENGSITVLSEKGFEVLNENPDLTGSVTDITEDDQGFIWVSVQNQGLLLINDMRIITPVGFTMEIESPTQIEYLGKDHFLIGTQENIYLSKFERESGTMIVLKRIDSYPGSKVVEIIPESISNYIIVSQIDGFFDFHFNSSTADFEFSSIDNNSDGLLDNLHGGILDSQGTIWLISMGNGIVKYRQDLGEDFARVSVISTQNGLVSDNVRSIFEDFEGNLWFGTYGEGLLRYNDSNIALYSFGTDYESNKTNAITGDKDNLYVVSDEHLLRLNLAGDTVLNSYPLPVRSSSDNVNTAYLAEDGRLWLGFEKSGLFVSESSNLKFGAVIISKDDLANSVNYITGKNGYLWVGTKKGVCRISNENGATRWFSREHGLPFNNIQQLYIDSKDRVLVATLCSEIHYINENAEVAQLENSRIGPQNEVVSILEGSDGTIWVGTYGNGVWKIYDDGNINYTRTSGLLSDFCYSLTLSGEGEPVIGHRGGISLIRPDGKRIKTFSRSEGINSSTEFFPNTVLNDNFGRIWFGTSEGLVKYSSDLSKGTKIAPRIHIEAVYIDGEIIDHGAGLKVLKPGQYELRVDYVGLHFSNPELVVYQTKLDGYNSDWSEPLSDRRIVYDRIEHGHYIFQIRAFNENDMGSEIFSAFELKINKPVYLSIWFYGIILFILGLSFYTILRIREQNHRMVQERLLKNLDEKTKEIIVKEEIIKERKKVEEILIKAKTKAEESEKLKTSFLQNISHEVRTPMNAIVGFSQLLKEDGFSIEDRNKFIDSVSENAESLLKLVDNIIEFSKLETEQLELNPTTIQINSVINGTEDFVLDRMQKEGKKGITLHKICPCDDSFEIVTDFDRLMKVLIHLLDNAVKFTESGKITYGYQLEESGMMFFVEDTGIGLSEDQKDLVFDLFRKVEGGRAKLYDGTGLGLTLAKYLVHMLGGKIKVDSKLGEGARFYFSIPLHLRQDKDNLKTHTDES